MGRHVRSGFFAFVFAAVDDEQEFDRFRLGEQRCGIGDRACGRRAAVPAANNVIELDGLSLNIRDVTTGRPEPNSTDSMNRSLAVLLSGSGCNTTDKS